MASVLALHRSEAHSFTKGRVATVELVAGVGVSGDTHAGPLVKHRSRVAVDPAQPNLRQVHLLGSELFHLLAEAGHDVKPGDLGENVTTEGVDLHSLAVGSVLRLGDTALVAVTGLRNPCAQIDKFSDGLFRHVSARDQAGNMVLRAGVMGVVVLGGTVRTGDEVQWTQPPGPQRPLERV